MLGIPIVTKSSVKGLKISGILAGIKNYKSIIKKKKKNNKLVFLAKSKVLADSVINPSEFVLIMFEKTKAK